MYLQRRFAHRSTVWSRFARRASVVSAASWLASAPAFADPPATPIALGMSVVRMDDATSCPTAEALRADLSRRSRRPWTDSPGSPSLEVLFGGLPAHWTAQVYLRTTAQPRPEALHFVDGTVTCDAIAALVVQSVLEAMIPVEDPASSSSPPPVPPRAPRDRTRGPSIALEVTGALGFLPSLGAGATVTADFGFLGPFHLAVHAGGLIEQTTSVTATATASFGVASIAAIGCVDPVHLGWLHVAVCAGPMVGVIHGATQNLPTASANESAWLSTELSTRVTVPIAGPFFVTATLAGDALLVRTRFRVEGLSTPVFEQSIVSGTASAGAGTWF